MVLVASASDHRHRRAAKSSPPAKPATPSTLKVPAAKPSAGAGLHGFSFSWGAHRRLRCSKDGAPVSASPSPPQHPHTPSPDKEKNSPQGDGTGAASSRPQRPRNLRPLRNGALQSSPSAQAQPRKRGFAVALTPEEIAHDFAAIRRCATRPVPAALRSKSKKRPNKAVPTEIDMIFPGFTLLDVDLDNYKIEERGQKR